MRIEGGGKSEIEMELKALSNVNPPSVKSKSRLSGHSRLSQTSSASKSKLILAQLKLKQVEEEQELRKRKRELKREREIILYEHQQKIEDLEMEEQMHAARGEVNRATIESQMYDCDDEYSDRSSEVLSKLERKNSQVIVESYLQSYEAEYGSENVEDASQHIESGQKFIDLVSYPPMDPPLARSSGISANLEANHSSDQLQQLLEYQRDTLQLMALGVDMPKREFLQFDGDPAKYPRFIKNFEVNVERRIKDNNIRLSYLIQLCSGKAKEAIESCVILSEDKGYQEAKSILKKNFGEKHTVVRALIDKVVKGPQIKANEPERLLQLARDMKACMLSVTHMNYAADINSMDNMGKVVKRLPLHLQARWAEEAGTLISHEIEPIFSYLVEFVEKKAIVANTTFGKLVGTKPDNVIVERVKGTASPARTSHSFFATQDGSKQPTKSCNQVDKHVDPLKSEFNRCLYCAGNHQLTKCFKFKSKEYKDRKDFVRKEKLCDNCLRKNHTAWNCRNFPACDVSGCKKHHHSLLHESGTSGSASEPDKPKTADPNPVAQSGSCGATSQVKRSRICMKIVPVKVSGVNGGSELETYAFLDNGSDTTLCLNELVDQLKLPGDPTSFTLTTVNGKKDIKLGSAVQLNVKSFNNNECISLENVLSVKSLPISERSIATPEDARKWSHLEGLQFPSLFEKKVTILIGNDVPEAHWNLEQRLGGRKQPYAVRTLLGWTLVGPIGGSDGKHSHINLINTEQEAIAEQLERMYNADLIIIIF